MGNNSLPIPILNDFIYTLLYEMSHEQKRGLPAKYLKVTTSSAAAKRFASQSTREEKEYLLSHFGFNWFYVLAPGNNKFPELKERLKEFNKARGKAPNSSLLKDGLYVHGAPEFIHQLRLCAQTINHPAHFLNLELNRQGYHIRAWSKRNLNPTDLAKRQASEDDSLLLKTFLSVGLISRLTRGMLGLSELEVYILTYLHIYKHKYVSKEQIIHYFVGGSGGIFKKTLCDRAVKGLEKDGLISRSPRNKQELTITSSGIHKVADFRDTVLANNNF